MITKAALKGLSAREIVNLGVCPECGGPIPQREQGKRGPASHYCSAACRTAMNNKSLSDGSAIVKLAKAWREARGQGEVGSQSFTAMVAALDIMLAADREAGRPSALYAAAPILTSGTTYQDRRRA